MKKLIMDYLMWPIKFWSANEVLVDQCLVDYLGAALDFSHCAISALRDLIIEFVSNHSETSQTWLGLGSKVLKTIIQHNDIVILLSMG